jgi:hypothetical protein
MLKTRAYSRKELESLRRADLQNLYKASHLSNPPIHVHFPFPLIVVLLDRCALATRSLTHVII